MEMVYHGKINIFAQLMYEESIELERKHCTNILESEYEVEILLKRKYNNYEIEH